MSNTPTELLHGQLPDKNKLIEDLSLAFAAIIVNLRENYTAQQLIITTGSLLWIKKDLDDIISSLCFTDSD